MRVTERPRGAHAAGRDVLFKNLRRVPIHLGVTPSG